MILRAILFSFGLLLTLTGSGQSKKLTFAILTDTHVGSIKPEDLAATVASINRNPEVEFVLVTGDLTNHGTKKQLTEAKLMLDKLNKKYYAIAGNHEEVWSASGGTLFKQIFGADRFAFEHSGVFFVGTDSGPILRHGHAHVPKDNLLWMDSVLAARSDQKMPVIFANHYPMNKWVDNYYEVISRLKKVNTKVLLCGHGHSNRKYDFNGLPGIMCKSVLPKKDSLGYNLVTIENGEMNFTEVDPSNDKKLPSWAVLPMADIAKDKIVVEWPDYAINNTYPKITQRWMFEHDKDIAGGFAVDDEFLYTGTFDGKIIALNKQTGKISWSRHFGGRIFSTPALAENRILFASTDGYVHCVSKSGKPIWKFRSKDAVVSSPLVKGNRVFIGFSDGTYRCLNLSDGKIVWQFDQIEDGFVQTATLYGNGVYFGAWNSNFYALDQSTGKLKWRWKSPRAMIYSPAMVAPIVTNGRVFIVTPDNFITCFDAETGEIKWRNQKKADYPVWFSSGLSADGTILFAKTRNNRAIGLSTSAPQMNIVLDAPIPTNNDSSPTGIPEQNGLAIFSSNNSVLIAVETKTGKIEWQHKIGESSINLILPSNDDQIFVSTNDGKIVCLNVK